MDIAKIKEWQKILEGQIGEMNDILENRFVFQEVKKIVENNPSINQDNVFYLYFQINYIHAQIMQLSRMLDQDSRTESFNNLLGDIENNPEIFDRKWRDEIHNIVGIPEIQQNFNNPIEEKTLNSDIVSENRCNLLCQFAPIKKCRDKRVAHNQASGKKPNLSFEKLDQFIDFIHEHILIYACFLLGRGYLKANGGLMSEIQDDWQSIFRVPWINE